MRVDLPAPGVAGGSIPTVRSPLMLDGAAMVAGAHPPRLGEHTDEVLADPAWIGHNR